MKLWKRWTAAVLAAAMVLLLLAACGPSGPSTPDAPDKPGSSETGKDPTDPGTEPGKDPTDETTEAQKVAAVVEALNAVRKNNGNNTPLELNEQACAFAKEMAQVQLDGVNGQYGKKPSTNTDYIDACATVRKKRVGEKASIGFGALQSAYPDANQFKKWAVKTAVGTEKASAERNNALVKSKEATLVGVGVVQNTDTKTKDKIPFMVVVMTY